MKAKLPRLVRFSDLPPKRSIHFGPMDRYLGGTDQNKHLANKLSHQETVVLSQIRLHWDTDPASW